LAIPGADETCVLGFCAWPGSRRATRLRRRSVRKQILCTFMAGRIGRAGMSYEYRGLQALYVGGHAIGTTTPLQNSEKKFDKVT